MPDSQRLKYECEEEDPNSLPKRVGNEVWELFLPDEFTDPQTCDDECTPCPNGWPYLKVTLSWAGEVPLCVEAFDEIWTNEETKLICPTGYNKFVNECVCNTWSTGNTVFRTCGQSIGEMWAFQKAGTAISFEARVGDRAQTVIYGGGSFCVTFFSYYPAAGIGRLGGYWSHRGFFTGAECAPGACGNNARLTLTQTETAMLAAKSGNKFLFAGRTIPHLEGSAKFSDGITVSWEGLNNR